MLDDSISIEYFNSKYILMTTLTQTIFFTFSDIISFFFAVPFRHVIELNSIKNNNGNQMPYKYFTRFIYIELLQSVVLLLIAWRRHNANVRCKTL